MADFSETVRSFRIAYPEELPITGHLGELRAAWSRHQVIIVGGDTGSGKTTQLPKVALDLGFAARGRVGITQPRRLAASAMARRVAEELGCSPGTGVGYKVRFDDRTGPRTAVKFMTDGILLAETRSDRKLREYSCIIIDEAHERSLNIDFLLGYLKLLLPSRPDLKVAISSATLDTAAFSEFFGGAPVVSIEGRTYPVEERYQLPDLDEDLSDQIARGVETVTQLDPRGDILVFLPGEREIRDAADLLNGRGLPNTEVLPLFGRLQARDQERVFSPGRQRRIILATNVAETSVTIPRIRFVIDSGLARIKRFNPRNRIEELQVETISQASARQRRGRCGRVAEGVCLRLYAPDDLERAAPYTDPEIRRSGLAGVILQMAELGLPKINRFPLIDPPSAQAVREGIHTLEDLRAIDPLGHLTADGRRLARYPVDPQLGKMLLEAERHTLLPELLVIASYLSIREPLERPVEKQQAADEAHRRFRHKESDFLTILNLWNAMLENGTSNRLFRLFAKQNFLNFNRLKEWKNLVEDLADAAEANWKSAPLAPPPYDLLHQSILAGVPRNIGKFFPDERLYLGTGGRKFHIFPGSGLFKARPTPDWLLTFALVETSRLFGRCNALIKPGWLELAAPHLCSKIYDQPHWDPVSGFVRARERLTFGGLLIHAGRQVHYGISHPVEAREIFIREALANGEPVLAGTWLETSRNLLDDLKRLEEKVRRPGTILDPERVVEHYLELLPPEVLSTSSLKELLRRDRQDYSFRREEVMQEQFHDLRPEDYPDSLAFSGESFRLGYVFDPGEENDGVTLYVPREELARLSGWSLDYLVPGFLAEKVALLLRSLPKALRQAASPLAETVTAFTAAVREGKVFTERPLIDALAEYLSISPNDFGEPRLPEYLVMKLAILNAEGKIAEIVREVPAQLRTGSRLGGKNGPAASGCTAWPGLQPLAETVDLPGNSGKQAHPALTDEGETIGVALYLDPDEAKLRHRQGLCRLFRLEQAAQVKFLKRSIRVAHPVELSFFRNYPGWNDDLLNSAILATLNEDPWEIRSEARWKKAAEHVRAELGDTLTRMQKQLEEFYQAEAACRELIAKLKTRSADSADDAREWLNHLFRPGFLRSPATQKEYARYLRGGRLRLERAIGSPARDETKLDELTPWIERFDAARNTVGEISEKPGLTNFWLLLEECRLATFAPEIPPRLRAPLTRLAPSWQELRL